ncbi:MAG: hypothetical protein ABSF49_07940 [Roseiarcus sp.]|jgi:hypothetical protein|uniref:hypothetical protein n=1 Tax=Roseiarcus sp. TaxID=1969460 RepID=UPI003C18D2A4
MTTLVLAALLTAAAADSASGTTLYSSQLSSPSGTAIIMQSGPSGTKPIVRKTIRPGYSILQQQSGGNSAIVIQQQSGD